ncbi:hypothetical protein GR158_12235 [Shinella sp. AETb1-6]|uniref:helix-turn-helix domain-containing protein n=1 Tax=Shinella sp. AETb1-6 TaxID=2692210 RepID=UPI0013704020|nr:helix-turn-helix domain-containing protein [Shinella sp. AETb1-6]MXN51891.1 hypothetical protein [Shinella sp. AETb1-6]
MNIQFTAKTFTSAAAMIADHAAVRRRLLGRPPRKIASPVPAPVESDPMVTVRRRLPPVKLHFHDAHVKAFRRWQMIAASGPCTEHILKRCQEERMSFELVVGPCRKRKIAHFRQKLMWEIKMSVKPSASWHEIGRLFGGRDHTTALHGVRAHQARVDSEEV